MTPLTSATTRRYTVADLDGCPDDGNRYERSTFVPLLVVEVGSPSTRSRDRRQKRDYYESVGCPAYWLLDPGGPDAEPVLTVLELDADGRYREVASVRGDEPRDATRPFAVRVVPADLVAGIPPGG